MKGSKWSTAMQSVFVACNTHLIWPRYNAAITNSTGIYHDVYEAIRSSNHLVYHCLNTLTWQHTFRMAELLSIQVHAPHMISDVAVDGVSGKASYVVGGVQAAAAAAGDGGRVTRLKKVDNRTVNVGALPPSSFGHMPKRDPIDVEFKNLRYSVSEGRNKGKDWFVSPEWNIIDAHDAYFFDLRTFVVQNFKLICLNVI